MKSWFAYSIVLSIAIAYEANCLTAAPPNVVWFVVDDMSPNFGCYGEKTIATPNVDRLAAEGTRFTNAYVTAPVCSPCRSALITGMYQTAIGSHNHRSGRGELRITLPMGVEPIPVLFQRAGYFTCIGDGLPQKEGKSGAKANKKGKATTSSSRFGKTDYNFEWDAKIYDSHDWADRADQQPFFMQVQLSGGKLREGTTEARSKFRERVIAELGSATDPSTVTLPPYYPRDSVLLDDWALYLDAVRMTDRHVGMVLKRLEEESLLDTTLIVFMTDHGISHARGKQFLYDEGTHVPIVVRGPGVATGKVRDDLIEHIDLGAISLAAAGIEIPRQCKVGTYFPPTIDIVMRFFAARDRCDETVDRIRSVRTKDFLYIQNFLPQRPHLQPNAYKDGKAIIQKLRALHDEKKLDSLSERLLFSPTRPAQELYRYHDDPWQLTNLAEDPKYRKTLDEHRNLLLEWMSSCRDDRLEEQSMYDSDMKAYLQKGNPVVESNIRLMKQWESEGK